MQLSIDKQQMVHDLKAQGHSHSFIARAVGCAKSTVFKSVHRPVDVPMPPIVASVYGSAFGRASAANPIRDELRPLPFAPTYAVRTDERVKDVLVAVLAGDKHFPFSDERTLSILLTITSELQPDLLVDMGDIIDCYHLSRFDKNPDRLTTLQDEIDQARAHLFSWGECAPGARKVLLGGNHDARIEKMLWNLDGPAKALLKLTRFRELMTMDGLLGLKEMGWEFLPEDMQTKTELLPKTVLKHGTVVRKWSGGTAQGEWMRYGRSGASGHVHRLAMFLHAKHGGGSHFWLETGCCCTLDPEYMRDPDWQNGFMVLTVQKKTGAFAVEPVYVFDGLAVFRGKTYLA